MRYENSLYSELSECTKRGWSKSELKETGLWDRYEEEMKRIAEFIGQRVKMTYKATSDFLQTEGEITGRIVEGEGGNPHFLPGRNVRDGYTLDAGLFEGFFAVKIPMVIETV